MTRRLYYDRPNLTSFETTVVERTTVDGRPAVVLDATAFYPEGGGQPADRGLLNQMAVLDVVTRPKDGAVLHLLAGELVEDRVRAEIDWGRRFDHMQQHSGQHLLSQAFIRTAEAETVGFHLGGETTTIDLDVPELSEPDLARAEALANEIVFDDRPISARFVDSAELASLPLRRPPQVAGPIRVVEIEDFDWSACGGTHVARTGSLGLIKIVKTERRHQQVRVTFRCGWRAWRHYDLLNRLVRDLGLALTVAAEELPQAVARLQDELRVTHKAHDRLRELLLDHEAASLLARAQVVGEFSIVRHQFEDRDLEQVRGLATRIANQAGHIALLGVVADKGQLVFARSGDVIIDMRPILRAAGRLLGGGGGGGPDLAQGGGPNAGQVPSALEMAEELVRQTITDH